MRDKFKIKSETGQSFGRINFGQQGFTLTKNLNFSQILINFE